MDSILTCTNLLVNQNASCSRSTTCRGIQLHGTLPVISSINEANPEKIWTTIWIFWISMLRHIFLPQDCKTIKKDNKLGSFMKTTTWGISAFNFRWFQQPIRIVVKINLATVSTSLWDFGSGPILAGARNRECMRTAKIGHDLRWQPNSKVAAFPQISAHFLFKISAKLRMVLIALNLGGAYCLFP